MMIEEYNVSIKYLPGKLNPIADALSRIPRLEEKQQLTVYAIVEREDKFPLDVKIIFKGQMLDKEILRIRDNIKDYPKMQIQRLDSYELLCCTTEEEKLQIIISENLQKSILKWFYEFLQHPGQQRMYKTISTTMYWPGLKK